MWADVIGREDVLRVINLGEDVEVFLTLLSALIYRLGFDTEMIRGETSAVTTPMTRCASTSKKELYLRLIPRLFRLQVADDATSELHLEVGLRGVSVRKARSVDLDVAAAVGSLRSKSTALRSTRRSTNTRPRRPYVPISYTPNRLFEAVFADELDRYPRNGHC